jgi:hypothetical protein
MYASSCLFSHCFNKIFFNVVHYIYLCLLNLDISPLQINKYKYVLSLKTALWAKSIILVVINGLFFILLYSVQMEKVMFLKFLCYFCQYIELRFNTEKNYSTFFPHLSHFVELTNNACLCRLVAKYLTFISREIFYRLSSNI